MVAAVRVHKTGGPEVLTYEDVEVPAPGAGQIRIKQHASGVNFIDTYFRSGLYPAPSMPFVTEEVWSWWQQGSVHLVSWPTPEEVVAGLPGSGDPQLLDDIAAALEGIRGAKSSAKVSMKTEVAWAEFAGAPDVLQRLGGVEGDLRAVGRITGPVVWTESSEPLAVTAELVAPTD